MTEVQPLGLEDLRTVGEKIRQLQKELSISSARSEELVVRERCSRTELVLRVASMLIEWDPETPTASDPAGYIKGKLDSAIGQFGLEVAIVSRQ